MNGPMQFAPPVEAKPLHHLLTTRGLLLTEEADPPTVGETIARIDAAWKAKFYDRAPCWCEVVQFGIEAEAAAA